MADLTLQTVPGADTIIAAAAMVNMASQVQAALVYNFGDADLVQRVGEIWNPAVMNLVRDGKNMFTAASVGGTSGGTKEAAQHAWTGDAATTFFFAEGGLESGYTTVVTETTAVGTALVGLAGNMRDIFKEAVGATMALIAALVKLAWPYLKKINIQLPKKASTGPTTPPGPTTPILIPGPGGTIQTAAQNPNPPTSGTTSTTTTNQKPPPKVLEQIAALIAAWLADIIAFSIFRNNFNTNVAKTIQTVLGSAGDSTGLPNGQLPTVASSKAMGPSYVPPIPITTP